MSQPKGFQSTSDLLPKYQVKKPKPNIKYEYQSYGEYLAKELADEKHLSLYIKLARDVNRGLLDRALNFVKDANANHKGKLFMWRLKQLRDKRKNL